MGRLKEHFAVTLTNNPAGNFQAQFIGDFRVFRIGRGISKMRRVCCVDSTNLLHDRERQGCVVAILPDQGTGNRYGKVGVLNQRTLEGDDQSPPNSFAITKQLFRHLLVNMNSRQRFSKWRVTRNNIDNGRYQLGNKKWGRRGRHDTPCWRPLGSRRLINGVQGMSRKERATRIFTLTH